MQIPYERLKEILQTYITNDAAYAETEYVRDVLFDVCGCTPEEIKELGFEYLLNDDDT